MTTKAKDISVRRCEMAEDILRFRNHYPLAKLLAFYAWATEEDGRGRMRYEREKTWSTGRRLVLFTTKATLPEGWQELFPEFARSWQGEHGLFEGANRAHEINGANEPHKTNEPNRPHKAHEPNRPQTTPAPTVRAGAGLPSNYWRLLSADNKTLWEVAQRVKTEVSEVEYKHWVEPVLTADTVDHTTLIVPFYGHTYKGQNPMQAPAFMLLIKHLREAFKGRIDGARGEWRQ